MGIYKTCWTGFMILSIPFTVTKTTFQSLDIIFPDMYNEYDPPTQDDGSPIVLKAFLIPFIVDEIVGDHMDFQVNFYFILQWNDSRLNPLTKESFIEEELIFKKLWFPEIQFRNCRQCARFSYDRKTMLLSMLQNQLTWYSRNNLKFICEPQFRKFPMDSQNCSIQIESYPVRLDLQMHKRMPAHLKTLEDIQPAQFDILESGPGGECEATVIISKFHCKQYNFVFNRKMSYHVAFTYLPSVMIVMVSWISFWLQPDMVAPRAAIGLTPLLALVTQFSGIQKSLPPVSYMKAIDVWMFVCMFLVFGSLVEFALANHLHVRKTKRVVKIIPYRPQEKKSPDVAAFCSSKVKSRAVLRSITESMK